MPFDPHTNMDMMTVLIFLDDVTMENSLGPLPKGVLVPADRGMGPAIRSWNSSGWMSLQHVGDGHDGRFTGAVSAEVEAMAAEKAVAPRMCITDDVAVVMLTQAITGPRMLMHSARMTPAPCFTAGAVIGLKGGIRGRLHLYRSRGWNGRRSGSSPMSPRIERAARRRFVSMPALDLWDDRHPARGVHEPSSPVSTAPGGAGVAARPATRAQVSARSCAVRPRRDR